MITRRGLLGLFAAAPAAVPLARALPARPLERKPEPWTAPEGFSYQPTALQRQFHADRRTVKEFPDATPADNPYLTPGVRNALGAYLDVAQFAQRGTGKTTALIYEALFQALRNPYLAGALIAPSYPAVRLLGDAFASIVDQESISCFRMTSMSSFSVGIASGRMAKSRWKTADILDTDLHIDPRATHWAKIYCLVPHRGGTVSDILNRPGFGWVGVDLGEQVFTYRRLSI